MASLSLVSLEDGIAEVGELQAVAPRQAGNQGVGVSRTRAVGRASVVILASHLEGYIDSLNLEAASVVNGAGIPPAKLSEALRLVHTKPAVEALVGASWEGPARAKLLGEFVASDAWLWGRTRKEPSSRTGS